MKRLFILFALVFPLISFSQNLVMTGNVFANSLKETGKIFFAKIGNKFDETQYVNYDKKKKYTFSISLDKIKNDNINCLVFTLDISSKSDDNNSCTQKIFVSEIINSPEFSNKKNIEIYSDLDLEKNCTSSAYSDAKEYGKERFVGDYKFIRKDTALEVELKNIFQQYYATLPIQNSKLMTKEFGSWDYKTNNKILSISSAYQFNERFGTLFMRSTYDEFKVDENLSTITFTSKSNSLKRNEAEPLIQNNPNLAEEADFLDLTGKADSWTSFQTKNLYYSEEIKELELKGNVRILFYLDPKGLISQIKLDPKSEQKEEGLVESAKELIKNTSGRWSLKLNNGTLISGWRYKDVTFK